MKLSLKLILLNEASVSPAMARIIKQSVEAEKKRIKLLKPEIVLPRVLDNLLKLRRNNFKVDGKLKKEIENDISRIKGAMLKLGLALPKSLDAVT